MISISFSTLIGHLHPVIVHLPIGFLLVAILMYWLSEAQRLVVSANLLRVVLWSGFFVALFSCITGFVLSQDGGYADDLVNQHMWSGIAVAAITGTWCLVLQRNRNSNRLQLSLSVALFMVIVITGHLGGSLTHGEGFLTAGFHDPVTTVAVRKPLSDAHEAIVYRDIIHPMFQAKCISCHGGRRQKGGLRMDDEERLMKGGKDGPVLEAFRASESELFKRVNLPINDEHHMPPRDKPQVTEQEILLLNWWINAGLSFTKKTKEIQAPAPVQRVLLALEQPDEIKQPSDIPSAMVGEGDPQAIATLQQEGVIIHPLSQKTNYLEVNFVNDSAFSKTALDMLLRLRKQILYLNFDYSAADDAVLAIVAQCENIVRLHLVHTKISDKGVAAISKLKQLTYLNLVGNKISMNAFDRFPLMPGMKHLFVFETGMGHIDLPELRKKFPAAAIDTGNYRQQFIEADTQIVKPPVVKK